MSNRSPRATVHPFAHLLARVVGSGRSGARADENSDPAEKDEDEEARKARRADEDEKRKEEDARRAEEDDRRQEEDARRAEEDGDGGVGDPEQPDDKGKNGKKAEDEKEQDPEADADDDDMCDEPEDEKEKAAYRRGLALGRARENLRGLRIFESKAAAGRPDLAATLAFATRNSSAEAGRLMVAAGSAPNPRGRALDDRMGSRSDARPGAGAASGRPPLAEQIIAAGKKRRGEG